MSARVAIVCGLLNGRLNGAERQIIRLANGLTKAGVSVTLVSKEGPAESLGLLPQIPHRGWYAEPPRMALAARALQRCAAAKRIVERIIVALVCRARVRAAQGRSTSLIDAIIVRLGRWVRGAKGDMIAEAMSGIDTDVVIAFLTDPSRNVTLALWGKQTPLVVAVRSDPTRDIRPQPWEALKYLTHRRASLITINARSLITHLEGFPEIGEGRVRFVPNIVIPTQLTTGTARQFICIGRLEPHKRVGLAIQAFARIAHQLPDWQLVIVGDGAERGALVELADELGVSERTDFLGVVSDVLAILSTGGLLVHPSGREGMPNAVMEALQCGVPALVMHDSPGAVELIDVAPAPAGIVIDENDVDGLARAMFDLASDRVARRRLGDAGRRAMMSHTEAAAVEVWGQVITAVAPTSR